MFPLRYRCAFTLIEMVVALCLIVLLLGIGLPSLIGQGRMRKLQTSFDRFDAFVAQAQQQSARDGKPYVLAWSSKGNVRLIAAEATDESGNKIPAVATFSPDSRDEHFTLERAASLTPQSEARWTFWPTGNCEPVSVHYEAPGGTWVASFNPLSGRGTIKKMIAR